MKVLLVGEYSHLHNSLKDGLKALGHEVFIIGHKDGFKNFPVDFPIQKKWDSGLPKKVKVAVYKISGFDITSYLTFRQFLKFEKQCPNQPQKYTLTHNYQNLKIILYHFGCFNYYFLLAHNLQFLYHICHKTPVKPILLLLIHPIQAICNRR